MLQSRRNFVRGGLAVVSLGVIAGCGVMPRPGQQTARLPRIGYLALGSGSNVLPAFREALAELGYVEGQTVVIELRLAQSTGQFPQMAAELVSLPVDVILAGGTAPLSAAMAATHTIPIVFPVAADPVANGTVASLARPGGNVTGLTDLAAQIQGKRLQLLREVAPSFSRLLVLADAANWDATNFRSLRAVQDPAESMGIHVIAPEVRVTADFAAAFDLARRSGAEAIIVNEAPLITESTGPIVEFAISARLPLVSQTAGFARSGGLIGYGANISALYRRAAVFVDKILKGANPAEMAVEQAAEFDFVVNQKTAQAIGISMPSALLTQATEVIQ